MLSANPYYYYSLQPAESNSSLDQVYQSGKVLVYYSESAEKVPVATGKYCIPQDSVVHFEDFIDNLFTEVPLFVSFGDLQTCNDAAANLIRLEQLSDQLLDDEYMEHNPRGKKKTAVED